MGSCNALYLENARISHPKIIGIDKNYTKNNEATESAEIPRLFQKPWATVTYNPQKVYLPAAKTHHILHQIQLGVFMFKGGKNIAIDRVNKHIGGYFLAVDFTDSDWLRIEKQKGILNPFIKTQDDFSPISQLIDKSVNPYDIELQLKVNGQTRQKDKTENMIFKINELICLVSKHVRIQDGDLVLTGTPSGSEVVKDRDRIEVYARVGEKVVAQMDFQISVEQKG